jgi:hypothetical protein
MHVKYVGPIEAVVVPWGGREYFCARGSVVEVPAELGASLLVQSVWEAAEAPSKPSQKKEK